MRGLHVGGQLWPRGKGQGALVAPNQVVSVGAIEILQYPNQSSPFSHCGQALQRVHKSVCIDHQQSAQSISY